MAPELQELIDAGKALYALTEKIGTISAEYIPWAIREAALNRWYAALLEIEGITARELHEDNLAHKAAQGQ